MSPARAQEGWSPPQAGGPSDELLARRALSSDRAALEMLVSRYQARIYRLARRLTGNRADAEEAIQETFLILMRRLRTFRGEARFSTWLYRIATNAALMQRRRRAARPGAPLERFLPRFDRQGRHAAEIQEVSPWHAEESLDRERLARRASRALGNLDERYRAPFVLRDLEELPTPEVARILGITEALVRQRVHRARLMLRGSLSAGVAGRGRGR